VEWEGVKYAYIYAVGSRAYYDLEYKGYGRKIFSDLFDFLRLENVKIVCIFDFTTIGYEMYLKIGFRVLGADKFLYKMLNEEKITCDTIKYVLTIDMTLNYDYFQQSTYMFLDKYADHDFAAYESAFDVYKGKPTRPYTDPVFIQQHTDIIAECNFNIDEMQDLYRRLRGL
jgi:hypothetical protein